MKIHKLNLENYYRNAFYLAACRKQNAPETCYPSNPEYNDVVIRVKPGEKATVALPVPDPNGRFQHNCNSAPVWLAPYMPKDGIMVILARPSGQSPLTPSITGVEFKDQTIPLAGLELYEGTRWEGQALIDQTGKIATLEPGQTYTVTLTGKLGYTYYKKNSRGQMVQAWQDTVVFNNTPIMKITIQQEKDNGPDTIIDVAESGSSITVDSALSDTSENPVQNKVIAGAIGDIADALDSINGEVI